MGLFKGMKDLAGVTKQAKQMQEQQQKQSGYKSGMAGQFQQMGDMLENANEQLAELNEQQSGKSGLLADGLPGEGVIVSHGVPARGAQWFNLDIDMEVHVSGKAPYRVNNQYMVPAGATLGPGVKLPLRVDPEDPAKIAIDWNSAGKAPERGDVRVSDGQGGFKPADGGGSGDKVADLERLAKLKESGALTDAEFEQEKAKLLGN